MPIVERGPSRGSWRTRPVPPRPPEEPRYEYRPPTAYVTLALVALCVLVFAYGYAGGDNTQYGLIRDYAFIPGEIRDGRGYERIVTHMFLHADWVHLLVNMICLFTFGRNLEPALGGPRFALLYLVAGIAGAAAQGAFSDGPMIGASGAIAGIVGAAAAAAPRHRVILFVVPMPLYMAVAVMVAGHVAAIAFEWDPGIAWYAHLGGLAAGAILWPVLRRR